MRKSTLFACLALLLLDSGQVAAQPGELAQQMLGNQVDDSDFDEIEVDEARAAAADANFDAVMSPQNIAAPAARRVRTFDDISQTINQAVVTSGGMRTDGASVEVPLGDFEKVRDRLNKLREKQALAQGPAVVLGAAEYSGEAQTGALALRTRMQVTLGRPDKWKTVPLIGDDVVLVRAIGAGKALPVSRRNGYHVWVTQRTGEVTLELDILVPARGPRGSIEYDFLVARTPVTRFRCSFPVPNLEPRLTAAVRSEVRTRGGRTTLDSTVRPTTRIHLVGFRDLGEADGRKAKIYAESLNLLSIDERATDLFSVMRYTILYAGTKEFRILIPKGLTVVSADGEGAFRYELESTDAGTLIKGETAFPIRNSYEISLRLHRENPKDQTLLDVPLPRSLGVEREHGWLGVEVTGKLKLEEAKRTDVLPVDVRQLPGEMVRSAVSPILKAYRYHAATAAVQLKATTLPEQEPASGSVDRIRATSVVSSDGTVLTDVRITLRNRLQHSLELTLPAGTKVLSTLLDGQPVKPSRKESGELMLPLKRSGGTTQLEQFTLQVVLEGNIDAFGFLPGRRTLSLPAVNLPVSSLAWTVHAPARNTYSRLEAEIEPQSYVGTASWHTPRPSQAAAAHGRVAGPGAAAAGGESADTGAMPVRIKVPQSGVRLQYARYWIDAGHPVEASVWFVRGWLRIPVGLLLALLLALGVAVFGERWSSLGNTSPTPWGGLVVALVLAWPVAVIAGTKALVLAVMLGAAAIAARRGLWADGPNWVREWARTFTTRFRERDRGDVKWSAGLVFWRLALAGAMVLFGMMALGSALAVLALLLRPY